MEQQVQISFTQAELNALGALLDAAVKASGIQGAKAAVPLFEKLEAAVADFNKSNPSDEQKEAA